MAISDCINRDKSEQRKTDQKRDLELQKEKEEAQNKESQSDALPVENKRGVLPEFLKVFKKNKEEILRVCEKEKERRLEKEDKEEKRKLKKGLHSIIFDWLNKKLQKGEDSKMILKKEEEQKRELAKSVSAAIALDCISPSTVSEENAMRRFLTKVRFSYKFEPTSFTYQAVLSALMGLNNPKTKPKSLKELIKDVGNLIADEPKLIPDFNQVIKSFGYRIELLPGTLRTTVILFQSFTPEEALDKN